MVARREIPIMLAWLLGECSGVVWGLSERKTKKNGEPG
jgi:hypothetical protein